MNFIIPVSTALLSLIFISETDGELQIKTSCASGSSSKDRLLFTFCQRDECCKTGEIPAQTSRCHHNKYQGTEFGQCAYFKFDDENQLRVNVTYSDLSAKDNWKPDSVKLLFGDDKTINCSCNGELSENVKSLNFSCQIKGKLIYFIVNNFY